MTSPVPLGPHFAVSGTHSGLGLSGLHSSSNFAATAGTIASVEQSTEDPFGPSEDAQPLLDEHFSLDDIALLNAAFPVSNGSIHEPRKWPSTNLSDLLILTIV